MHKNVQANINSFLFKQEEIEIEAKTLRVGKIVGVVTVELRKKETGKIIAQGRHTKYLPLPSKMWKLQIRNVPEYLEWYSLFTLSFHHYIYIYIS